MRLILDNCIEQYEVNQAIDGLEVSENGKVVCELEGCSFEDFHNEWGNIDEDELYQAIRDEIELNETMAKLSEQM